jgi:hypothetical protein
MHLADLLLIRVGELITIHLPDLCRTGCRQNICSPFSKLIQPAALEGGHPPGLALRDGGELLPGKPIASFHSRTIIIRGNVCNVKGTSSQINLLIFEQWKPIGRTSEAKFKVPDWVIKSTLA